MEPNATGAMKEDITSNKSLPKNSDKKEDSPKKP